MVMSLLLAACSTQTILTAPETSLKLIADTVVVNVTGPDLDAKVLDQLTREIRGQLIIAGFEVDKKTDKTINLNVQVTAFTPGHAALRITIGFGAGRGSLIYTAEYTDNAGQTLAKMNGRERFTGTEISFNQNYGGLTTLGGAETATTVLIKEAAKHIVELAVKP